MANFLCITASNRVEVKRASLKALKEYLSTFVTSGESGDMVHLEDTFLEIYGYDCFQVQKWSEDETLELGDSERDVTAEFLIGLAKFLKQPLVVQCIGHEKCRFPLAAWEYKVHPDGKLEQNGLTFDLKQLSPLTIPEVFVPVQVPHVHSSVSQPTSIEGSAQRNIMEGTEKGEKDQDLFFTCADCGEITGLQWVISNRDLHEAQQTIRLLLGYGCEECQATGSPESTPSYADRYLLRLIRHFLFTRLQKIQDRIHLLLTLNRDLIELQQELLGLTAFWSGE